MPNSRPGMSPSNLVLVPRRWHGKGLGCETCENVFIESLRTRTVWSYRLAQGVGLALQIPWAQVAVPDWTVFSRIAAAGPSATQAPSACRAGIHAFHRIEEALPARVLAARPGATPPGSRNWHAARGATTLGIDRRASPRGHQRLFRSLAKSLSSRASEESILARLALIHSPCCARRFSDATSMRSISAG